MSSDINKTQAWIKAFRLRTLPLALSSIALGSLLAYAEDLFNWLVLVLAITTTLFLQILSNLANDYGDSVSGADNEERIGPERAVQSGVISLKEMRNAIILFVVLSLASGIGLIYVGTKGIAFHYGILFLVLGLGAIAAAIKYTVGKKPYGYSGLGDIFVFLFFGLTGVLGTYYLHAHQLPLDKLFPAAALGFLSAGVLNLNNMRDREPDAKVGKNTLAVKLGAKGAKVYHIILITGAMACAEIYTLLNYRSDYQLIFLVTLPMLLIHIKVVWQNTEPAKLDPQLKKLAMTTLFFALTFGLGLIIE